MANGRLFHLPQLPRMGSIHTLGRTIALAALVGVASGVSAIIFQTLAPLIIRYTMVALAGYEQQGPAYELELPLIGKGPVHVGPLIPWLIVLIPAAGGLISGWLTSTFAPEAQGPGTDAAINTFHHKRGYIRPVVPIVKLLASVVTLGMGGSGGREGPIAQVGAGFGSMLATKLGLSDSQRRTLMLAGLGAGVGTIFHAPLAGAIFGIEVLYRDPDFEAEALIPAFIATAVAYTLFSITMGAAGYHPLFAVAVDLGDIRQFHLLGPLAVLALAMSAMSFVYVKCLYGIHGVFQRITHVRLPFSSSRVKIPFLVKPMVGGLLTGTVAVILYYATANMGHQRQLDALNVLSYGYGFLQRVLVGDIPTSLGSALAILLAVGLGKILTTSLTIGSGASAGEFGASMVMGGSLGMVIGVAFHAWIPSFVTSNDQVVFAILGMAGFFAAAAKTPVAVLIMVSELTGSYALLLLSMWVCALSYLTSGNWTIYSEQMRSRLESPAHRGDFIIDVLKGMSVNQAINPAHRRFLTVPLDMPLNELSRLITSTLQSSFPAVNDNGTYYGLFSLNDIRQFLYESDLGPLACAQDLATRDVTPLTLDMDLSDAIGRFAQERFDELPVVDEAHPDKIVAMLRRQDVITAYDKRLLEMRTGEE